MAIRDWYKEDEPQYQHDCNNCVFLGQDYQEDRNGYDLYICCANQESHFGTSVLARYGNEPREYISGPLQVQLRHMDRTPWSFMAIRRAIKEGLITGDTLVKSIVSMD